MWYPQNFVPWGLIPRRTLLGSAGCSSAGYQTLQSNHLLYNIHISVIVLRGLISRKTWFHGVWYPPGSCSAGSDTPQDLVLRGIRSHWQIKAPQNQTKSFESLPFSLKGNFLKIVCMYKLHYRRLIGSMLKKPPALKNNSIKILNLKCLNTAVSSLDIPYTYIVLTCVMVSWSIYNVKIHESVSFDARILRHIRFVWHLSLYKHNYTGIINNFTII